jgi:hypothetical protein
VRYCLKITKNRCRDFPTPVFYQQIISACLQLAATAAATIVAAATAAIAAAAEQNHEQNDNPAASTIIFETHNTRLLCVSFI